MDVSTQTPAGSGCTNDMYTITRTWTASDPCGNTAQCVQVITVIDDEAPVMICPPNITIECDEPPVTPGLPVIGSTAWVSAPANSLTWPIRVLVPKWIYRRCLSPPLVRLPVRW